VGRKIRDGGHGAIRRRRGRWRRKLRGWRRGGAVPECGAWPILAGQRRGRSGRGGGRGGGGSSGGASGWRRAGRRRGGRDCKQHRWPACSCGGRLPSREGWRHAARAGGRGRRRRAPFSPPAHAVRPGGGLTSVTHQGGRGRAAVPTQVTRSAGPGCVAWRRSRPGTGRRPKPAYCADCRRDGLTIGQGCSSRRRSRPQVAARRWGSRRAARRASLSRLAPATGLAHGPTDPTPW
jgi:hypothetical protein